jgi:ketosteroid isomerase-like protein
MPTPPLRVSLAVSALIGLLILVILGLGIASMRYRAGQGVPQGLMDVDREFARATAARGIDGWMSYVAEDAAFMPDGAAIVRGKREIRATYEPAFAKPSYSLTWEPVRADVSGSGDLGYTYGQYESQSIGKDGQRVTSSGKYVTIWKRQADGSWKAVVDIGNSGPPVTR